MNCASVLTGVLRRGVKPLFATSHEIMAQQRRNTFILQRKYPLGLYTKDKKPGKFRSKNFVYELVENTELRKKEPIDIIVTTHVDGIGDTGTRVSMNPQKAYNNYLLPGLAVYASPDNIKKYKSANEAAKSTLPKYSSPWVPRTIQILSTLLVNVIVSQEHPWTVQKFHVRAALRKINIHVPDYAITMPERPITGPDLEKENKEFYVTITINKREEVKVRCRLHHFTTKENDKIIKPEFWKEPAEPIFLEDKPILDSLPKHLLLSDKSPA